MRRDPGLWLEDILTNGRGALEFLEGKTEEDYLADKGLRAMVERKLFVVGEAVTQLKNGAPEVAERLSAFLRSWVFGTSSLTAISPWTIAECMTSRVPLCPSSFGSLKT